MIFHSCPHIIDLDLIIPYEQTLLCHLCVCTIQQAFGFKCNSRSVVFRLLLLLLFSSLFGFVWVGGVIGIVIVAPMANAFMGEHPKGSVGKRITILSINGSGVHGLILATILHKLEAKLQVKS